MKNGMGSHQSHKMLKDEWLTPPEIISSLGEFDLDPCHPVTAPWPIAKNHFNQFQDGLNQSWAGRVWMNPPYGSETGKWLDKLSKHQDGGIALIFARTETKMFFDFVWERASALLFIKGRLFFHHVTGEKAKSNAGAPSVLIAYGNKEAEFLKGSGIEGAFIDLREGLNK